MTKEKPDVPRRGLGHQDAADVVTRKGPDAAVAERGEP